MSTLTEIFTGSKRFKMLSENGDLVFELEIDKENIHQYDAKITRYPVEDGSDLSDHVILQPDRFSARGLISLDSPSLTKTIASVAVGQGSSFLSGPAASLATTGLGLGANALSSYVLDDSNKLSESLEKIKSARDSKTIFSIESALMNYSNMVLTKFNSRNHPRTNRVQIFDFTFEKMTVAFSQQVGGLSSGDVAEDVSNNAEEEANGTNIAETVTDPSEISLFKSGFDKFIGAVTSLFQ